MVALKLVVLSHSYWPEHSPPQRRWMNFIREFREVGWDVDVITPRLENDTPGASDTGVDEVQGPYGETVRRVRTVRTPHTRWGKLIAHSFSALMSVPAGLKGPRPDAIVATVPSLPIAFVGFLLSRVRRVPLILDMRDAWPDLVNESSSRNSGIRSFVESALTYVQQRAALVVTVTEGFARTLRARGLKNVATISNGVNFRSVRQLPPPTADSGPLSVLYLGNHGESQRLDVLIRAAALAGPAVSLRLVGDGVRKPQLQRLAHQLRVDVEFLPAAHGRDAVLAAYEDADTCVISLRDDWKSFETTIPSKTYELLATGRHVTGIVRGEAAEILRKAAVGDVVNSSPSALAHYWCDLAANRDRLRVSDRGRRWVEQFADNRVLAENMVREVSRVTKRVTQDVPASTEPESGLVA